MEIWTAHRLAKRARGRGLPARLALRRLLRAGDLGEHTASDLVWMLWLLDPRDELWAALARWRRPPAGLGRGLAQVALGQPAAPADVIEAARRVGHPIAVTARGAILTGSQELVDAVCEAATTDEVLTAFCVEHRLAPASPHRAAVFFLLTGQDEQYRLADPDHSLLAIAYQGTTEEERARIRARAAGEPEIARVLADTVRRGRLARLGKREAEYLVDAFVARRDWVGLWELVKELPVIDAATAVHRFDGWRPDGHDAALFDTLAAADLAELTASHAAAARPVSVSLPIQAIDGGSIAPDGQWIIVNSSSHVSAFTFGRGGPPQRVETWTTPHRCHVLALDNGLLVTNILDRRQPSDPGKLSYHGYGTFAVVKVAESGALARTEDGFAALIPNGEDSVTLHLLSCHGREFGEYERRVVDVLAALDLPTTFARQRWTMAVEPESGLVAFVGDRLRLARLTEAGLHPLGTAPFTPGLHPRIAFSAPDRLVGMDDDRVLRVWRLEGDEPHLVAERQVAGANPLDLPRAGVIVMQDMAHNQAGRRQLRYVDRDTLVDVPVEGRFNRQEDTYGVFGSPDGSWFGVCYWGSVEVVEVGFTELVHRPLAATTPTDLHTVRARLVQERLDPATRPFLELLYACLVDRFGTDVALGGAVRRFGDSTDIALGGTA